MTVVAVKPAVTPYALALLEEASFALSQAIYEGSHARRQEPAPAHGSPWDTPDLPAPVLMALLDAQDALAKARAMAVAHTEPV